MRIGNIQKIVCAVLLAGLMSAMPVCTGMAWATDAAQYIIGPEDVLEVSVWDNRDLSGRVTVSLDGYVDYQFIGRVQAAGLTVDALAARLVELFSDGYIINPQVTVQVAEYRSRKVHVVGEATRPGTYYLTRAMTIVEVVSLAGGPTARADNEVTIVRAGVEPETIVVDLEKALQGDTTQNVSILSGDSIYLSKARTFFIMGEVNRPGQYTLEKGMTVRRAISVASGNTEKAALNRVTIIRREGDADVEMEVDMQDAVMPADTIVVPQSYF